MQYFALLCTNTPNCDVILTCLYWMSCVVCHLTLSVTHVSRCEEIHPMCFHCAHPASCDVISVKACLVRMRKVWNGAFIVLVIHSSSWCKTVTTNILRPLGWDGLLIFICLCIRICLSGALSERLVLRRLSWRSYELKKVFHLLRSVSSFQLMFPYA